MANGQGGGGGNRSRLGILGRSAIYAGATVGAETLAPGTGAAVAGTAAAAEGLTKVIQALQGAVEKLTAPFEEFSDATAKAAQAFGAKGWFESFVDAATKVDDLRANLQRATGQTEQYASAAISLQGALSGLGLSTEEATKTFTALHDSYSDFSDLSPKIQKSLAQQTASLTRLGISQETTAKNYQLMGKALKMTDKEMQKATARMTKSALSLGLAPQKMAKDYTAIMPQLMHWGRNTEDVFYKLAAQSKATGVEMQDLLGVAAGFDEFESASKKVANLNMILGGTYFNTVQMMRADEAEKIEIMREGIKLTGLSVDQFGRFLGKDVMKAMGFKDMATFFQAMGAPDSLVDKYRKKLTPAEIAQQNLNKAISKGVKLTEQWSAFFERTSRIIGNKFLPIMKEFGKFMMSGEGGKGITDMFNFFAMRIKDLVKWWDQLDGPTKSTIKNFAKFQLKLAATSFAVSQFSGILSPVLGMFTSPGTGLIAALVYVSQYWGRWDDLIKDTTTHLYRLDNTISNWLGTMQQRDGWEWLVHVERFYDFMKIKIPKAIDAVATYFGPAGSFSSDFDYFSQQVRDGYEIVKDYFRTIQAATAQQGGGLQGFIAVLKDEIKNFIREIAGFLLSQFSGVLSTFSQELLASGQMGPVNLLPQGIQNFARGNIIADRAKQYGISHAQSAEFIRAQAESKDADSWVFGGISANTEVRRKKKALGRAVGYTDLGKLLISELGRKAAKKLFESDTDDIVDAVRKALPKKHDGGSFTRAIVRNDEGIVMVPPGMSAMAIASSMMNGGNQNAAASGPINLYVDGEKLASSLPLVNALNKELGTKLG